MASWDVPHGAIPVFPPAAVSGTALRARIRHTTAQECKHTPKTVESHRGATERRTEAAAAWNARYGRVRDGIRRGKRRNQPPRRREPFAAGKAAGMAGEKARDGGLPPHRSKKINFQADAISCIGLKVSIYHASRPADRYIQLPLPDTPSRRTGWPSSSPSGVLVSWRT